MSTAGQLPGVVSARVEPVPPSTCWVWTGPLNNSGYGSVYVPGEKSPRLVHRLAYESTVGPIPPGLTIDHLCRVRSCVNPAHMEVVTQRENNRRGGSPSAVYARREACDKCGGEFERGKNAPARRCRACYNERHRQYMAAYRPARAEAIRLYMAAYRKANPEKWAEYNKRSRARKLEAAKSAAERE